IKAIEDELGDDEAKRGLYHEIAEAQRKCDELKRQLDEKTRERDRKLTNKAREIKNDTQTFDTPTYNIALLRTDIPLAKAQGVLAAASFEEHKRLLRDEAKPKIGHIEMPLRQFTKLFDLARTLLSRQITLTQPISELVSNHLLEEWVRRGMDLHRGDRHSCGFCGQPLTDELWTKLDAHFNKESEKTRNEIRTLLRELDAFKTKIASLIRCKESDFYAPLQRTFRSILDEWQQETAT